MDDVRIGIVGLGNMGTLTADFIYAGDVEHCVIGAICDIREERILYAKKHFTHLSEDCFYKDFRKMIAEAMMLYILQYRIICISRLRRKRLHMACM